MRVVAASDTHSRHDAIIVPDGDVLIHAGDLSLQGTIKEIEGAFSWLSEQSHKRVIAIPGNHDWALYQHDRIRADLRGRFPRVELLIDEGTVVGDLQVWGSPWSPWFNDWAFNFARGFRGLEEAERRWNQIPDDVGILITHGPVYGILDKTVSGEFTGCPALKARVEHLTELRLHVCGHIHESYGIMEVDDVTYVNACCCDANYEPTQSPIIVDL
jgi:predicted phosphodiesterase